MGGLTVNGSIINLSNLGDIGISPEPELVKSSAFRGYRSISYCSMLMR
jgi:hypothetical protein